MSTPIVNQREYRVLSLRRSGQHALIHWLADHFSGEVLFANNVTFSHPQYPRHHQLGDEVSDAPRTAYIFNVEDADLATAMGAIERNEWDTHAGASAHVAHILLVRDPYNLFASRLRNPWDEITVDDRAVALWKQHARAFLRLTRHLPEDTVMVCYNEWVASASGRQRVAQALGLPASPATAALPRAVPRFGGGSSFDKLRFQGRGHEMKVLDRWQGCVNDPRYFRHVLRDAELRSLAQALLGSEAFARQFAALPSLGKP